MAATKSINYLPEVFRSDTNRKFISATLDQLVSEPDFVKIDGFVGRKFSPTYLSGDHYLEEPSKDRQNYQLEPSVVVQDAKKNVTFYNSYIDLLQKIRFYGGLTNNHSRLFETEAYNFDGMFDFDKFVNFNQYVWLPDGPPEVVVSAIASVSVVDFSVHRDSTQTAFTFSGYNADPNPIITLVKGLTYTFNIAEDGNPFWIQTFPGVSGSKSLEAELLDRSVYGLKHNGVRSGLITFAVPSSTAQDGYADAVRVANVDFATDLTFAQVQNHLISIVRSEGGIDGTDSTNLDGRTVIFVKTTINHMDWIDPGVFDHDLFDQDLPNPIKAFEDGLDVEPAQRYDIWRIKVTPKTSANGLVTLEHVQTVNSGEKVYIKGGRKYAGVEFFKNDEGYWDPIPPSTASLTEIYYTDDADPRYGGSIKLIEPDFAYLDIPKEILRKVNYTSPNGVQFTNGMKVKFDSTVLPASYANSVYIVEGVGTAIRLISTGDLMAPELYSVLDELYTPDYITIARGSSDLNAWSRSNRWFHSQIIDLAASYNNDPNILKTTAARAKRPIIEFEPNIYLFNYGHTAKAPVDILDFSVTDAFNQVEGKTKYILQLPNNVKRPLTAGTRIIFANEQDPNIRNRIYRVDFITTSATTLIHLVSQNTELLPTYSVSGAQLIEDVGIAFVGGNPDTPAEATITVDYETGAVVDVLITNPGLGYRGIPAVIFNNGGPGSGAVLNLSLDTLGSIATAELISGGVGYFTSPVYGFIPIVTLDKPVPSIGAYGAKANPIMAPTTLANVIVNYSGINYIADPYIEISTNRNIAAVVQPFYSKFKYIDYIRITNPGAYPGSLSVVISSPNKVTGAVAEDVVTTGVIKLTSSVNIDNDHIVTGNLVYGPGITGGTTVTNTTHSSTYITVSSPTSSSLAGTNLVFVDPGATFYTSQTAGYPNYLTYSNVITITTLSITADIRGYEVYGDGIPLDTTVVDQDFSLFKTLTLSANAYIKNKQTLVFKPVGTKTTTVTRTSRFSDIIEIDDSSVAGLNMFVTGGATPIAISNITTDDPILVTTTIDHGLSNGDSVVVRGVVGTSELNDGTYYIVPVPNNTKQFYLFIDQALLNPVDGRNYLPYVSGGVVAGYTIEYGISVKKILDSNRIQLDQKVSVLAGTTIGFIGKQATATSKGSSTGIYAVTVVNPGAGYTVVDSPAVTFYLDLALTQPATEVSANIALNDNILEYFKIVSPGDGYQLSNSLTSTVISSVSASTSDTANHGSVLLTFASADEIKYVKPGWRVWLVIQKNQIKTYTDFARVEYATPTTTGPDGLYRFYMDGLLTKATISKVVRVTNNVITLDTPINSLDADQQIIDLPAGSNIYFTAKSRFFTAGEAANSAPVGDVKSSYFVALPVFNSPTLFLNSVMGLQTGMTMVDLAGQLPTGLQVVSVDVVNKNITLNITLNGLAAGTALRFSTVSLVTSNLKSTKIQSIDVYYPGKAYTSAPGIEIQAAIPIVEKIASCVGGTASISVPDLIGIRTGMEVTSEYDKTGAGITTGAHIPRVVGTNTIQTGLTTFIYEVVLDFVQPAFTGLILQFKYNAKAIAQIQSSNNVVYNTADTKPDTYGQFDTVMVSLPTTVHTAVAQSQVGVDTYNQYWYDGNNWLVAQQKQTRNQSPYFDIFNSDGVSASNTTVYTGSKFSGTKLFAYKVGTANIDPVLGFALSHKNFQNVGDIEFVNHYDTDTFSYLKNKIQINKPVNYLLVKQKRDTNFRFRNMWTRTAETTKQYQALVYDFDGQTNYFELDALPASSETVPYLKVYVDNQLLLSTAYSIVKFGPRYAVAINPEYLLTGSKVDLLVFSNTVSNIGYFQVPANLELNAENQNFTSLTLGQLRQHLITMTQNHYGLSGPVLGKSNLRDLATKNWQGLILQHASPTPYASAFLGDNGLEFVEATEYAQKEYSKFKNKFLDKVYKLELSLFDIPLAFDQIMDSINVGKNNTMPWFDSDMVPYGTAKTTTKIPVVDARQYRYQIPSAYSGIGLSRRSVLVYLYDTATKVRRQLIKGHDFVFNADISAVDLGPKTVAMLTYTTYVEIVDYPNTTGSYVPDTPTKLGLYPKFVPTMYLDTTYQTPIMVIQGHDGSITPAFNDVRDELLLELELRIYNSIKIDYQGTLLDIVDSVPGKYRKLNYNRQEFNLLLTRNFLRWIGSNQVDYNKNNTFISNNAWTWNYKLLKDLTGEFLPGFWRGIFNYFYDTDRPHLTPWEMLGFYEMPNWWEKRYGPAPYTGGNRVLWGDLEKGYIAEGPRAGFDTRFARPGLSKVIPVDDVGMLKSPEKVVIGEFDAGNISGGWSLGDCGPVESAWRRSSEFPYAVQIAVALSRPAFYFGTMGDVTNYNRSLYLDQLVLTTNGQRITKSTFNIPDNGVLSGTVNLTAGYTNWVRDWFSYKSIDGTTKMMNIVNKMQLKLSHHMAGYSDTKFLNVFADQSSPASGSSSIVVPAENYRLFLNKSAPVSRIVYSAVIIAKSTTGYSVSGYDNETPYFTIVPSVASGNAFSVTVLNESVTVFNDFQPVKITIPYGYEFTTRQELSDFLIGYGRYLIGQGFLFETYAGELEEKQDWLLAVKEFLAWSQQGWKLGTVIILSPTFNTITIDNTSGVIDEVTGGKLLDQNFVIIKSSQFTVLRDDNTFTLTSIFGQTIALADLNLVQYEHVLLVDNATVFNDIIYQPELGNRQYRLKLSGHKTGTWTGQLNPAGFIYNSSRVDEWQSGQNYRRGSLVTYKDNYYFAISNIPASTEFDFAYWNNIAKDKIKTGLLPNFAYNAEKFNNIYDTDNRPTDLTLNELGQGLTGFRTRQYFQDLKLDPISQSKMYQGLIRQKGSVNSVYAMTTGKFNNVSSDITLYEEWGLRVGDYGALGSDQSVELILNESKFTNNPSTLVLHNNNDKSADGLINFYPLDIYRYSEPTFDPNIIKNRTDVSPRLLDSITAGYPRIDDVDATIFDISQYKDYYSLAANIGAGFKLWVAKDFNKSWNVYRANETSTMVSQMRIGLDNQITVITDSPHGLKANDLLVVKNFSANYDGFYRISSVSDTVTFSVAGYRNLALLKSQQSVSGNGVLLVMRSVRYNSIGQLVTGTPLHDWRDKDRVWVDNDTAAGVWAVFEKTNGWKFDSLTPLRAGDSRSNDGLGTSLRFSTDSRYLLSGAPNNNSGSIKTVRITNPGFLYTSAVAAFDNPTQDGGVSADARVVTVTGNLLTARVTSIGTGLGYDIPPVVTINGNVSLTTGAAVSSSNVIPLASLTISVSKTTSANVSSNVYVSLTDINDVWVGDTVSGTDDAGNTIPASTFISNINYTTSTLTLTKAVTFNSAKTLNFGHTTPQVGDTVTIADTAGFGVYGNTVNAVFTNNNSIRVSGATSAINLNSTKTAVFTQGTGGNVQARLNPTALSSVVVVNGGAGFTSAPLVEIVGGGGSGATAIATISSGVITAITLTSFGIGYTYSPTVNVIATNPGAAACVFRPILVPSPVASLIIGAPGIGYRTPTISLASATGSLSGAGAAGNINVTNRSVSSVVLSDTVTWTKSTVANVYQDITVTLTNVDNLYIGDTVTGTDGFGNTIPLSITVSAIDPELKSVTLSDIISYRAGQNLKFARLVGLHNIGYTFKPNVTIVDVAGSGSGATAESVFPTGTVRTFYEIDGTISQVQNIPQFGLDAIEFGHDIDMGTDIAVTTSPGSYKNRGVAFIAQASGASWIAKQVLYPTELSENDRFGESVAMSKDNRWIYVGAPGANRVYVFAQKITPTNQSKITVVKGQFSYVTQFTSVRQNTEIKVVGNTGKLYGPGFDYNIVAGIITFTNFKTISGDTGIYISQQYPTTVITSPPITANNPQAFSIRGVLQTAYTLNVTPVSIEQLQVQGADGRMFIADKDYSISGKTLTFLNTEFIDQSSITVTIRDRYYVPATTLTPTDETIWNNNGTSIPSVFNRTSLVRSVYPAYISGGVSSTTMTVGNAIGLQVGMIISGTGFTSGQTITQVLPQNADLSYTIVLSAVADSTPAGFLTITYNGIVDTYAQMTARQWAVGNLIRVRNLQEDGSYASWQTYQYQQFTVLPATYGFVLVGTENRNVTRGIAEFGKSLSATVDGYQLVVGAPGATATDSTSTNSGKIYVFDRSYQVFSGSGTSGVFGTTIPLSGVTRVTVDDVDVTENLDYTIPVAQTISFGSYPRKGSRVKVDVNNFNLIQMIESPDAVTNGRFGQSVAISPTNKEIFVGAPGYRDIDYYNGQVYRFTNQAKRYNSTIGNKFNLNTVLNDSLRINDVEVTLSEAIKSTGKIIKDIQTKNIPGIAVSTDGVSSVNFDDTLKGVSYRGAGYSSSTIVATIDAPDTYPGRRATVGNVTLFANGAINAVSISDPGSGYTFAPGIMFTGGNVVGATATVSIDGGPLKIRLQPGARQTFIDILPGVGSSLSDVGLEVYYHIQTFRHPSHGVPEKFGTFVRLDQQTGDTLLVSSEGAATLKSSTFDGKTTVIDKDTTRFIDVLKDSGAVYVYDYLGIPNDSLAAPSEYLFNQNLQDAYVLFGDNFGSGIAINNNYIIAGSDKSDYFGPNSGLLHRFQNSTGKKGWAKLRTWNEKVDIDYVNKAFIYDVKKQVIVSNLDYIDPAKGKILGLADQDIDYKTAYDPATYNKGTGLTVTIDGTSPWNHIQVGRTWWNLDSCRVLDYEQGELNYRISHWGQFFPGSTIEVLEWVESLVLPSQYGAVNRSLGVAKHADNSAYVEINYIDTKSGLVKTKYYFWAKNKSSVDSTATNRTSSAVTLQELISDPRSQNIPFMAVIASNAVSLYDIGTLLNADKSILKIEYAKTLNHNIAHSEFELVQQNNAYSFIPTKLIDKLIDSLSGENSVGDVVPDLRLQASDRLGIGRRPRQTMISDPNAAIKVFVQYVNKFFIKTLITRFYNIAGLGAAEPVPPPGAGFYDQVVDTSLDLTYINVLPLPTGYKVLVLSNFEFDGYWTIYEYTPTRNPYWVLLRIQSYNSTNYWSKINWYAEGYNDQTQINYIVKQYKDISTLTVSVGDVVKVLDAGDGNFELYAIDSILTPVIVGVENGTIQLNSNLYDSTQSLVGFDNSGFDSVGYAKTSAIETRKIILGIFGDIFINTNKVEINNIFFLLVNYILSEQVSVDWLFKSSFVSVLHKLRKLEQYPAYIKDQQDYYEKYINEVKPYRTQIRNYLIDYQGSDQVDGSISDFDLAPIYDKAAAQFRSLNIKNPYDVRLIKASSSVNWLNYYKYSIQSIQIVNGGAGYTSEPTVAISGGGGSGATGRATIDTRLSSATYGQVLEINMISYGSGYTTQPTITFAGGGGSGAKGYAVFSTGGATVYGNTQNKRTRTLTTAIKFDRISYTSNITEWKSYTTYHPGDIIAVPDVTTTTFTNLTDQPLPRYVNAYLVLKRIPASLTVNLNIFNDRTWTTKLTGANIDNAADRVAMFNRPGSPDIAQLFSSPDTQRLDPSVTNDSAMSAGNEWNRVVHSVVVPSTHEYQFLAVGNRALVGISKDGAYWETVPGITYSQLNLRDAVMFDGTTWVAVGNRGSLLLSTNAINWTREIVGSYKFSPTVDNTTGAVLENAQQVVDFTSVGFIRSTRSRYVIAVGNGSNILLNPYTTSLDIEQGWRSAKPQPGIFGIPAQFLKVMTKPYSNLVSLFGRQATATVSISSGKITGVTVTDGGNGYASGIAVTIVGTGTGASVTATVVDGVITAISVDVDGNQIPIAGSGYTGTATISIPAPTNVAQYKTTITSSGYFSQSATGTVMQEGYVIVAGVNGNMYITSFNRLDDLMQGYNKGYNYDIGKQGNINYPWIPMNSPLAVEGVNGQAGEQISGVAMSDQYDRWIVAVGSGGTLLWNKLDSPVTVQIGTSALASDVIGLSVIDHEINVFNNFRYFDASNFAAPLTPAALVGINLGSVTWDGEKFVAVGDNSTVIWGIPGAQDEAFIELTNQDPTVKVVTTSFIPAGTALTFTGGPITEGNEVRITKTLYTSRDTVIGSSKIYLAGFAYPATGWTSVTYGKKTIIGANWRVNGTGIPDLAIVKSVGKFAKFTWKYARGSGRNFNLRYNSITVNTTTVQLSTPIYIGYNSVSNETSFGGVAVAGPILGLPSNALLTYYDLNGNKFTTRTTQILRRDTTTIALESNAGIGKGYLFLPDVYVADLIDNFTADYTRVLADGFTDLADEITSTLVVLRALYNYGITIIQVFGNQAKVLLTPFYEIAGQLNHLSKDIPDLIPGTSYPGVQVIGQAYTATGSNSMLSLDTIMSSDYTDAELGTRPDDILVSGGQFIDNYASHNPEELVPGQVFDSLQMTVFTAKPFDANNQPDFGNIIAYRMFTDDKKPTVYYRITAANTAVMVDNVDYLATYINVSDITRLPDPNQVQNKPGSVWINGERINYFSRYVPAIFKANTTVVGNILAASSLTIDLNSIFGNLNIGLANVSLVGSQIITANISRATNVVVTGYSLINNTITVNLPQAVGRRSVIAQGEEINFFPAINIPRPGALRDLRRGAARTSIPLLHLGGSLVTDASPSQEIGRDTILTITGDLTVNNGLAANIEAGQANTSVYQSAIVSSVPQAKQWLDLGT
jgi:hypothetical protein